jgi:hypothetical protein
VKPRIKRGIKNEGYSHDVIENTWRKNVSLGYSHDVDDNKGPNVGMPRC